MLEEQQERRNDEGMDDMENYRVLRTCPVCDGARLKKESLHFKVDEKNIFELATWISPPLTNGLKAWKIG
jgi:excinuclease ABC subunit A